VKQLNTSFKVFRLDSIIYHFHESSNKHTLVGFLPYRLLNVMTPVLVEDGKMSGTDDNVCIILSVYKTGGYAVGFTTVVERVFTELQLQ
jgi:hypothetical protein